MKDKRKEDFIDVKSVFYNFLSYWYYFLFSILICLFLSFLYNRYTKPIYSVSTTIEIRDDNNSQLKTLNGGSDGTRTRGLLRDRQAL